MSAERADGVLRLSDVPLNLAEDELTVTAEPGRLHISAAVAGNADSGWLAPTASVLGRATEQILDPLSASGELVRPRPLPAVVALDVVAPWAGTLYGDLGNPWSEPFDGSPWLRASLFIALDALAAYFLLTANESTGHHWLIGAEYLLVSRAMALTIDVPAVQRRNALAASGFRF